MGSSSSIIEMKIQHKNLLILIGVIIRSCKGNDPCNFDDDCFRDGKLCEGIQDVGCICKNNICKISANCGKQGAFFLRECWTCVQEDCEDEGVCRWEDGECRPKQDESCAYAEDCYSSGKMCDGIQDVGCLCKGGQCKISAGCGTMGAFFRKDCSFCRENDCEDEGACVWNNGRCNELYEVGNQCNSTDDCQATVDWCQSERCVCSQGSCKVSSGCGANQSLPCDQCGKLGCEDEDVCLWSEGKCQTKTVVSDISEFFSWISCNWFGYCE